MEKVRKTLAMMLVLCITLGLFPGLTLTASAATGTMTGEQLLATASGGIITITGQVLITTPLRINGDYTLTGGGTLSPSGNFSSRPAVGAYNSMIVVSGGTLIVQNNVKLDALEQCRVMESSNAKIELNNATIRNGHVSESLAGSGIMINGGTLNAYGGTRFTTNKSEANSVTSGGAVYIGGGATADFADVVFEDNSAHSGGAIYAYRSHVKCGEGTKFVGNTAGQRGGAIHCHGIVELDGTIIDGKENPGDTAKPNRSGQYGGAVYVSASDDDRGNLIMRDATVSGNRADNSGGGIFVADKGQVYIGGKTSVSGNELTDVSGTVPTEYLINNIYVATPQSKLVVYAKLENGPGSVGVSTSNPYWPKILASSTATVLNVIIPVNTGIELGTGYTMENAVVTNKVSNDPIKYDSSVWVVKDIGQDPAAASKPECVEGNRWLAINPNYVPGPSDGDSPRVIFDYNLPGAAATLYPDASTIATIKVGDSIPVPVLGDSSVGNVDFKFLGWFDAPVGGTQCGSAVTVQAGTRVYYAHWDVSTGPGPGPSPTPGDLFTVFWNMNYDGGGVTSSLVGTFKLSTTVTVSASSSGEGGSLDATATQTQTKDVTIAFSVPRAPMRKGYIFGGWATSPTATTGTTTPATPTASTTYYAVWTAQPFTLTWNGNGGTPATSNTAVKYDDPITPPATKPTRTGYTFTGWHTDAGCTVPLVSGTTVTGNQTLYAGWQANEYEIVWSANYTGGAMTTVQQRHDESLRLPAQPVREGYRFDGWYTSATGGSSVSSSTKVTGDATYYAHWSVNSFTLTWDRNTGNTGGGTTTQEYGTIITPPATPPTKVGYTFTGWYMDKDCKTPLTHGTLVTKSQTFYAGWTANEFTIQWNANYTGGGNTSIKQHYDEELVIPPDPTRVGFVFGGWYTEPNGAGTRAEAYGTVTKDEIFYANWVREAQSYTVQIQWDDLSDNDLVRPESIRVSLMANDLPTGMTYLFPQADADASGNLWSHTFTGLPITDVVSQPITYSVAITSPVSDEYSYGIENKSATLGYILMTHTLITTDINSYTVWADDSNNDGYRPSTVSLQLYANGEKINDAEGRVALSGSGDTWTYTFQDFQKYYPDADGNKGLEIKYTLEATATNPGELGQYSIDYHDYTIILTHAKDTISKTVGVEWNDSNDKDGKRPASMTVQLYADNVPVQGKYVTLSDANHWSYTWNDLPKLTAGGRKVVYSAQVTSTLVDYTAKSTEMTIEMTYVPSSTSIAAFALWTDQNDADGLRPDFITAELARAFGQGLLHLPQHQEARAPDGRPFLV